MTENAGADPPAEDRPRRPRGRARPAGWRPPVRWFAAELMVVVSGILLALAVQAWWEGRADRALEREYLRELLADLRETERVVAAADPILEHRDRAGALLVQAFFTPERPPRDSVLVWYWWAAWYETPRPVLGTVEALVSTGDLALLRDLALRSAITSYLDESRTLTEQQLVLEENWQRGTEQVGREVDFAEVFAFLPQARLDSLARAKPLWSLPAGPRRRPFPLDTEALLRNRAAYDGLWQMNLAKQNMAGIRVQMRAGARRLRARVEAALAGRTA